VSNSALRPSTKHRSGVSTIQGALFLPSPPPTLIAIFPALFSSHSPFSLPFPSGVQPGLFFSGAKIWWICRTFLDAICARNHSNRSVGEGVPWHQSVVGFTEIARPEGPKSEARRVKRGGVLREGMFPSPLLRGLRSAVSSPNGVRGESPTTWRFGTFYIGLQNWCRFCQIRKSVT